MSLENYNDVLSVGDVCKILGIGRNTAYEWLKTNIIPNRKIMRKYIIPKAGVELFLKKIAS